MKNTKPVKAQDGLVTKVAKKVGNTKVKDLPSKTTKVIKRGVNRVTKDDVESAANVATMGLYARGKRLLGGKYKGERNGGKVTKAKSGTSLGAKSVESGYDKNYNVTRADFIPKKAKSGSKMKMGGKIKKAQMGGKFGDMGKSTPSMPSIPTENNAGSSQKKPIAKSGASMKKCKYGCK